MVKSVDPQWIKCPRCGERALGNYKGSPRLGKCTVCSCYFNVPKGK